MTRSQKLYGKTALLLAGVAAAALLITLVTGVDRRPAEKTRIVASFYPVYIAALNLADGIEGVEVESLTGPTTGCLHDYQLSPDNRIALSSASVLAVNGAGAESFLADLLEETPDLPVIDTSEGIPLLESGMEHDHGGGAHDSHDGHDSHNEHIWTSPALYHKQVENLRDGLAAADPAHAEQYRENAAHYLKEIDAVGERLRRAAASLPYQDCIIFHDSLAYMAQDWGLTVAASLPHRGGVRSRGLRSRGGGGKGGRGGAGAPAVRCAVPAGIRLCRAGGGGEPDDHAGHGRDRRKRQIRLAGRHGDKLRAAGRSRRAFMKGGRRVWAPAACIA